MTNWERVTGEHLGGGGGGGCMEIVTTELT
jgi:hypothetical protein